MLACIYGVSFIDHVQKRFHERERLNVLTLKLFCPVLDLLQEVLCLLLDILGLLVDAVQTSRFPAKRLHLHLQLTVAFLCVVEALRNIIVD